MDSGNSGSLQSSSGGGDGGGGGGGGDELYDSRTESLFLNHSTQFNHLLILQPPPPSSSNNHHHHQLPSTFFDTTSFSQSLNPNPNSVYNLDSLWSRNTNPNPMYNTNLDPPQDPYLNPNPVDDNINLATGPEKVKNPKKRTRASRRAPTTVLTTDTTNFRQMVQDFTGIPAAPFSASSSSPFSRRLDLYGGGIAPLHPLRPSAQKIIQPSYLNSTTTSNFHIHPSETHGFTKQPLNLSNLQNQMFPFQTVSQTNHPQQGNVTEREIHRSEPPNTFPSSSRPSLKRWRGQHENLLNFEEGNGNSENAVVSSKRDGDQLPGNEDSSWIGPSPSD